MRYPPGHTLDLYDRKTHQWKACTIIKVKSKSGKLYKVRQGNRTKIVREEDLGESLAQLNRRKELQNLGTNSN